MRVIASLSVQNWMFIHVYVLNFQLSSRLGRDYEILQSRHTAQKRNLEEIDKFLGYAEPDH
jgi:hypothetical protein